MNSDGHARFHSLFESLEERVLFDGVTDASFVVPHADLADTIPAHIQNAEDVRSQHSQSQLIIVDSGVENADELIGELLDSRNSASFDVLTINGQRDGIHQISEYLETSSKDYSAIHIVSHGEEGSVALGSTELSESTIPQYADQLAGWSESMTDDADLLFYGCDLAGSQQGKDLVDKLSGITGADVAASDDLTGHESLGGDWDLEFRTGEINHAFVLAHAQWFGVLSTVTGTAYIDYNNDGNQDVGAVADEVGIENVTVTGYDENGIVIDSTTTDANGAFTLNNAGNVAMRVEFTNVPTGFSESILDPSTADPDAVSSIAFTSGTSNSVMNLALHRPSDVTDPNSLQLVASCYFFGDGQTGNEPAIIRFDYTNEGDYAQLHTFAGVPLPATPYVVVATIEEVGSTGGIAYQRDIDTYFASAHMKRHSGFGPGGSGAIYMIEGTGTPVVFANLPNADDPHPTSTIGDATYVDDWNHDPDSFDAVGKIGLGDLDLSEDGKTIYSINLHDRSLYEIPIGSDGSPLDVSAHNPADIVAHDFLSLILADDATALGINPQENIRPYGTGVQDGKVYIGLVNTAQYDINGNEGNLTAADMDAYVYRFDPEDPAAVPEKVLEFSLDYKRQAVIDASFAYYTPGEWNPWVSTYPTSFADGNPMAPPNSPGSEIGFPQPLLTDIEFDNDGSMILGFRDRFGDQGGYFGMLKPDGTPANAFDSGGDIIRANFNEITDSWTIESELVPNDGTDPASTDTSIEFYNGEFYGDSTYGPNVHNEIAQGGLTLIPGYSEVVTTAMDPVDELFFSGGFVWLDNTTGGESTANGRTQGLNVFSSDDQTTFGKGNGFGDLEFVTPAAETEVGDRVWLDEDGDGIQDAGELNVPDGVVLELYDMTDPGTPVLVGTTTTSSGQYLFNDSNVAYTDGGDATGLRPFTDYEVQIPASEFAVGGTLEHTEVTNADAGSNDAIDSDATQSVSGAAIVAFSTDASGDSVHNYDIGLIPLVDLSLDKSVNVTTAAIGDTVTWTIEVTNDAAVFIPATGVVVEDVLPVGQTYVNNSAVVPGSGSFDDATGFWTVGDPIAPGETVALTFQTVVGVPLDADDYIDLELSSSVDNSTPLEGDTVEITYTLLNNPEGATSDATGVSVANLIPAGMTYAGVNASAGSFDNLTGEWDLSAVALAPGQSETIIITATVDAGTTASDITIAASVATANETDVDSTAGNAAASEDDDTTLPVDVVGVATRNISGNIFLDANLDGFDVGEGGVNGVIVKLYDEDGNLVQQAQTDTNGDYSFTNVTNAALRMEFENWDASQSVSTADPNSTGPNTVSSIAFLSAGSGDAVADLAIYKPFDAAEYITSCFINYSDPGASPSTQESLIIFNMDGSVKENVATFDDVGSVNGIGLHVQTGDVFAGAFQRRYSDMGPDGNSAIYRVDAAGNLSTFIKLDDFFGADSAGAYSHDPSDWFNDNPGESSVGHVALGDVETSADGEFLYTINLHDNRLYKIPIGTAGSPTTPADYLAGDTRTIERYNVLLTNPAAGAVTDATVGIDGANLGINAEQNLKPFALKFHDGKLYVGMINTAQYDAGGTQGNLSDSDINAYIYEFDTTTNQFASAPLITFNFGFLRDHLGGDPNASQVTSWHPWTENYESNLLNGPQPWLTDIEFDSNEDLILGIRDRRADMAFDASGQIPGTNPNERTVSGGDLLRATLNANGSYSIESHVTSGGSGIEYYNADTWPDNPGGYAHAEVAQGGLVQVPGFSGITTTAMDAAKWVSGGVRTIDNGTGDLTQARITLFDKDSPGSLGKANGLGDLEYTGNLEIEVGNRVWIDADNDGLQDAGEEAIQGVTLHLFDMSDPLNPVQVGTTVTDVNGEYYFNDSNVSDGGVQALRDYEIRIDDSDFLVGGPLHQYNVTTQNNHEVLHTGTANVTGDAEFDHDLDGTAETARNQRVDVLSLNNLNSDGKTVVVTSTTGGSTRVDSDGTVIFVFDEGSTAGSFDYEIVNDRIDSDATNIDSDMDGMSDGAVIAFTAPAEGSVDHSHDIGLVQPYVDLELEKLVDRKIAEEGETVVFTLYLYNNEANANVAAQDVVITDALPSGLTYVTATGTSSHGGTFDLLSGTWTLVDPLEVGETAKLTFEATINMGAGPVLINSAQVNSFNDFGGQISDFDSSVANDDGDRSEDDENDAVVFVGTPTGQVVTNTAEVYAVDQTDTDSEPDNENHDYSEDDEDSVSFELQTDYGDLPNGYGTLDVSGGAVHLIDGTTFLGSSVDDETDGAPSATATGDDTTDTPDDEDGVVFNSPLMPGQSASIDVTASVDGYLNAWIDFNSDGALDEVLVTHVDGMALAMPTNINDLMLTAGTTTLQFDVPGDAEGNMAARFRFTADPMGMDRSATGFAPSGEVEDYVLGSIGNVVFYDDGTGTGVGNDGLQSLTEPGAPGVNVYLLDNMGVRITDPDGNDIVAVTGSNGEYEFPGLPPNDYKVEFELPAGYYFTQENAGVDDNIDSDADQATGITDQVFTIGPNTTDNSVDAGLVQRDRGDLPASFNVSIADGGPSHTIDGATFLGSLVDGEADATNTNDATGDDNTGTTDDEDGVTFVTPLVAGTTARIDVEAATDGYLNAWVDFNGNGTFDSGEQIATDEMLTAGTNTLMVNVPADAKDAMALRFRFTSDDPGGALGPDGHWDNGEVEDYLLGAIGDFVWQDNGAGGGTAYDGIQDANEPVVPGVTVYLLDGMGNRIQDANGTDISTITDMNGEYQFAGLPADSYSVEFVAPAGTEFTLSDVGTETNDSDADRNSGITSPVTIIAGEINNTLDAGLITFDYGDLPDNYGTTDASALGAARHALDTVTFLGAGVDAEPDGQPSLPAAGDDMDDGNDDEDGILFQTPLTPNTPAIIEVTAGSAGFLNAWVDYDGDGTLDEYTVTHIDGVALPSPVPISDLPLTAGMTELTVDVPGNATGGTPTRFRFTSDQMAGNRSPNGEWANGEVEDYVLGAIGDTVWLDNGAGGGLGVDGIQDPGEAGVPGVVVNLLNEFGNPVFDAFGAPVTTVTDMNGNYVFSGLPQGDYKVEFELPNGYLFTNAEVGSDDAADSDADQTTGITSQTYTIGPNDSNPTVDAGLVEMDRGDLPAGYNVSNADGGPTHSLDGRTFLGATVDAELDALNTPTATGDDTTASPDDEDGVVFVTPLSAGEEAQIQVTAGADGFLNAWIDFNGDGILDEVDVVSIDNVDQPFGTTLNDIQLTSGVHNIVIAVPSNTTGITPARFRFTADDPGGSLGPDGHWDNGEVEDYVLGSIGDIVWVDSNGNGVQDLTEPPIEGVVVNLLASDGVTPILNANGAPVTTTTAPDGTYEFAGLPPNDYKVEFVLPHGLQFTDTNVGADDTIDSDANETTGITDQTYTIDPGTQIDTVDAGVQAQDFGDLPVTYQTEAGSNGPSHGVDGTTFLGSSVDSELDGTPSTDALGDDNDVAVDDEDGVTFVTPLAAGTTATIEVEASKDGFLNAWIDFNGDGDFDPGEQIATDEPLTAGTNSITVNVPADATGVMGARFRFTEDDPMGALTHEGEWDNGEVEDYILNAIGNYVWHDNGDGGGTSGDGVQDAGEPVIENATVYLLDGNGNRIQDANGDDIFTMTDAMGHYEFAGLPDGSYSIEVVAPTAEFRPTDQNLGGDDALDSDIDETTGISDAVSVAGGEVNDTLDAGYVMYDLGDLPVGYNTELADNGPSHVVDGVTFLGAGVDAETDGQPSATAEGDDSATGDDEDGIVFVTPLSAGEEARIQVTAGSDGFLNAWIDFDGDGVLEPVDVVSIDSVAVPAGTTLNDLNLTAGVHDIVINVPASTTGITPARFRFTSDDPAGALGPNGHWDNGEVEDYVLGSLGDIVWVDSNANGLQDNGEPPIGGVTVNLMAADGVTPIVDANGDPVTTTTATDGTYEFAGLPAGDYKVEFELPTGYQFTDTDVPSDDALDSDANEATGVTDQTYTIDPGTEINTVDAGVQTQDFGDLPDSYSTEDGSNGPSHGIDGTTFLGSSVDAETDGSPSNDALGDDSDATPDDEDGVTFVTPLTAGSKATIEVAASTDGFLNAWIDFNGNGTFDAGEQIAADLPLTAGTNTITVDVPVDATGVMGARFRFTEDNPMGALTHEGEWDNGEVEDYILNAIGNYVWHDNGDGGGTSGDGVQDAGEPVIENATVYLLDGNGNRIQDANGDDIFTMTDAMGHYEFAGLPDGDYAIEVVAPEPEFTPTDQNEGGDDALDSDIDEVTAVSDSVSVAGGEVNDTLDAGFVMYDLGDLPDGYSTELASNGAAHVIDGVTFLGAGVDAEVDGQPTTDATGDDTNMDDEDGVVFLTPLTAGDSANIQVSPSVDGYLNAWIDLNTDGVLDEIVVTHIDGVAQPAGTTIDDLMLTGGTTPVLTIAVPADATSTQAARFRFTEDAMGADRAPTGVWDNGEVEDYVLGAIGDVVWVDSNADGMQDSGEPPIEGVVVNLLDGTGAPVLDPNGDPITTTTAADGSYEFAGLPAGDYKVEFELPTGYQFTDTDVPGDDAADSDANETTGITDQAYTINPGTEIDTVDAGVQTQDFGDLPDSYSTADASNGPSHGIDGTTFLGSTVDAETDGSPSANALGDDSDANPDDEDGVTFVTPLTAGTMATLEVEASTDGFLNAWIDFNGNGTFDAGEQIAADQPLTAGTNTITVDVPTDATGVMGARFRFTEDDPMGALTHEGEWDNGEVEDYILNAIGNYVWHDNGDGGGTSGDGVQDAGEPVIENATVYLLDGNGNRIQDANGDDIFTMTDAMGHYEFAGLPDGDYAIEVVAPEPEFTPTDQNLGGDDTLDSDIDEVTGVSDSVSVAGGEVNDTLDAGFVMYDLGDLPDGYSTELASNGAAHVIDGVTFLGAGVDAETDGQPTTDATGDDANMDDEDGIVFLTPLTAGDSANIQVSPSVDGYLNAWIDFNTDGVLDEVVVTHIDGVAQPAGTTIDDLMLTGGTTPVLTIAVPADATSTQAARFRFTEDAMGADRAPTGIWDNGEVEDYVLGALGDIVWVDSNGDGVQDSGEPPIEGVVVNLLDGTGAPVLDPNGDPITTTTAADGSYEFAGLPAGDYQVEFELPTGYQFTDTDQGTDDAADSDADETTGITGTYTIDAGTEIPTVDAGVQEQDFGDLPDSYSTADGTNGPSHGIDGSTFLGSTVDAETDGSPSSDALGDDSDATPDDEDGVTFVTPLTAGTTATIEVDASTDGFLNAWIDFNGNGTFDAGEQIATDQPLTAGTNTITVDVPVDATGVMGARFRFTEDDPTGALTHEGEWDNGEVEDYILNSIGNFVWHDNGNGGGTSGDGVQDAGEPPIEGATVYLLDGNGNRIQDTNGDDILATTDADGFYEFTGLPDGDYAIEVVAPEPEFTPTDQNEGGDATDSDIAPATGISDTVSVAGGEVNDTLDAGFVMYDLGDLPDGYSTELASNGAAHVVDGVTFLGAGVDAETDGQPTADASGDGADEDGVVFLTPLTAGDSADIQVSPSVDGFLNAWIDFNGDGTLDEVIVTHVDGVAQPAGTTIDDLMLTGGTTPVLTIAVPADATGTQAARFRFTEDAMGADRAPDGVWDNGEVEDYVLGAVGDVAWIDSNGDGVQDASEPPLEGVVVNLLDGTGASVLDPNGDPITTTTAADGSYEFTGLPAGSYAVEFELPTGLQFTDTDQGTDDSVDSDADETTGVTAPVTIAAGETNYTLDGGFQEQDFGDLPDSYGTSSASNGAVHGIDGTTFLGTGVDADTDGTPTSDASGDDSDATIDDENGVTFVNPLVAGTTATIEVEASTDSFLNAWIDFNGNGTFDAGEQIAADQPLTAGTNTLTVNVPADATGVMGARFRVTADDPAGALGPDGAWDNGEVEDYVLNSIGNYAWYDNGDGGGTAGDGVQDTGEPPMEGVTVYLLDANGNRITDANGDDVSTVTDADGFYEFTGLPDGDYAIEVEIPDGFGITPTDSGSDDAADNDVDQQTATSSTISVAGGEVNDTLDVGFARHDYGDLPAVYGETTLADDGARHIVDGTTFLGSGVDVDGDGVPADDALSDDNDEAANDEDGVTLLNPMMPGTEANIEVVAGSDGFLNAWIDFNSDGVLDEVLVTAIDGVPLTTPININDLPLEQGTHQLTIDVPESATGTMAARFRFSNDQMGAERSTSGEWLNGEVEDYVFGTLGNLVFFDTGNGTIGNGVQDPDELGVDGVVVHLLDANGDPIEDANGDPIVAVTDENGEYEFPGLPDGDYRVRFELPEDHWFTVANNDTDEGVESDANFVTGVTSDVYTVCAAKDIDTVDAGILPDASLGDRVWFDVDADGVQDPDEQGISGIEIQIDVDIDGDGVVDYTETTTTDINGEYLFPSLPPGSVTVTMVNPPAGHEGTFSADGGATELFEGTLDPNEDRRDVDFGLTGTSTLAGTVHEDGIVDPTTGIDGVQQPGEPGIPGVTITLQGVTDTGIPFTVTTTTDTDGNYEFDNLPPGTYTVIETQPTGPAVSNPNATYLDGLDAAGSNGGSDQTGSLTSDTIEDIVLGVDEDAVDYDFSELAGARIDGNVFLDQNDDGTFDPDEDPIPGTIVTLEGIDVFGNPVIQTVTTDENGYYEFTDLYSGEYRIIEEQPDGYNDGQEQVGNIPTVAGEDQFESIFLGPGDRGSSFNFGERPAGTSGNPPRFPGFPPVYVNPIIRSGSFLGGPGPIYSGIPINSSGNPLTLESGRPIGGGYTGDGTAAMTEYVDSGQYEWVEAVDAVPGEGVPADIPVDEACGCEEVVVEESCDTPVIEDACDVPITEEVPCDIIPAPCPKPSFLLRMKNWLSN